MAIMKTKLEVQVNQAWVSYWVAKRLTVDVFCVDFPNFDEQCKLMDKLSAAEKKLEGRLQALENLYEDVYGEKVYPECVTAKSKLNMRMYDSLWKYQLMAKKLTDEMRATA